MLSVNAIGRVTAVLAVLVSFVVTGGARASALPGGDIAGALTFGVLDRTYQVHVPDWSRPPGGPRDQLHGAGITGGQHGAAQKTTRSPDQHGSSWHTPMASTSAGPTGAAHRSLTERASTTLLSLGALIDRLSRDYGVVLAGSSSRTPSAGAFMANRLACERSDTFSAVSRRLPGRWASHSVRAVATWSRSCRYREPPIRSCRSAAARCSAVAGTATSWQLRRWRSAGAMWMAARVRLSSTSRVLCTGSPRPDAQAGPRSSSSRSTVVVTLGRPDQASTRRKRRGSSSPRTAGELPRNGPRTHAVNEPQH